MRAMDLISLMAGSSPSPSCRCSPSQNPEASRSSSSRSISFNFCQSYIHTFTHSHTIQRSQQSLCSMERGHILYSAQHPRPYLLSIRINKVGHVVTVVEFGQNVVSLFWIRKIPVLCYPSVHLLSLQMPCQGTLILKSDSLKRVIRLYSQLLLCV